MNRELLPNRPVNKIKVSHNSNFSDKGRQNLSLPKRHSFESVQESSRSPRGTVTFDVGEEPPVFSDYIDRWCIDNIDEYEDSSSFDSAEELGETSLSINPSTTLTSHRYLQESTALAQHRQAFVNTNKNHHQMGEEKRLFISNSSRGGGVETAEHHRSCYGGVGSRLHQRNKVTSGSSLNGGKRIVGAVVGAGAGSGAGLRNGADHHLNGSAAAGDSDGMMGSGGESDSSEEIHYGPGFVSRLKSRYMSVALRGTPRGGLGTLRRTASLEDFLDLTAESDRRPEDAAGLVSPMLKYTHRINQPTQRITPSKV